MDSQPAACVVVGIWWHVSRVDEGRQFGSTGMLGYLGIWRDGSLAHAAKPATSLMDLGALGEG